MAKRVNIEAHPSQLSLGSVDISIILELFPFALVLDHDMRIQRAGEKVNFLPITFLFELLTDLSSSLSGHRNLDSS